VNHEVDVDEAARTSKVPKARSHLGKCGFSGFIERHRKLNSRQPADPLVGVSGFNRVMMHTILYVFENYVVCRAVAMQLPQGGRVYQGRFRVTGRQTSSRNNGRAVFSTWSVPRCYKQGGRSVSSVREPMKRGLEPEAEE
jgi:hypothetical protein